MNALFTCIENESNKMAALVDVLREEQVALTQAPSIPLMDVITEITQRKNQLISLLAQLGQERKKELVRLGFNQSETSIPRWLQDQAQSECWATLMKHTKKAKELNRVNGLLISKHLMRNRNTLEMLYKFHRTSPLPALYGANGHSNKQRSVMRGFKV